MVVEIQRYLHFQTKKYPPRSRPLVLFPGGGCKAFTTYLPFLPVFSNALFPLRGLGSFHLLSSFPTLIVAASVKAVPLVSPRLYFVVCRGFALIPCGSSPMCCYRIFGHGHPRLYSFRWVSHLSSKQGHQSWRSSQPPCMPIGLQTHGARARRGTFDAIREKISSIEVSID